MTAIERRMEILYVLLERRHVKICELQKLYSVSRSTIKRDIRDLSISFPICSEDGRYGGIFILDGFKLGMKYLTDDQCKLLEKISETLAGEDLALMKEILCTFRKQA